MNSSLKPHFTYKEARVAMANDIAPASKFSLPSHLQGKPKSTSWGEIDPRQRMLPRLKLLQASSPEIVDYPGQARAGEFWHTTLTESLGHDLLGVPIMRRQSYNLWAPRGPGEDRGILARARDFIHWDPPSGEFQVRYPMNPKTYVWKLARTVKESGLDKFGSSRDDDPDSPPAATLTFEVLWFLPDFDMLALTLNTRSGVKEARRLFAMVDAKPASNFDQKYRIVAVQNRGPTGEAYYGYKYRGDGYCDEALSKITEPMFQQWKDIVFTSNDEEEDVDGEAAGARRTPPPRDAMSERGARPVTPASQVRGAADDEDIPF